MASAFQQYYVQRVKHLFNHLHDFELNRDEISLHDLRVELKKIRAITRFLRKVYPHHKLKKASRALRSVFAEAGVIREFQLIRNWLIKENLPILEQQFFSSEVLENAAAAFQHQVPVYKKLLREATESVGELVQVTNALLPEQYTTDLFAQLEGKMGSQPDKSEWHELRKLIKQWTYARNWSPPDENALAVPLSYWNKLQEEIGYWHDLEMIRELLYRKQVYLSQDIEIQKDFNRASARLDHGIRYREKKVAELLSHRDTLPAVPVVADRR